MNRGVLSAFSAYLIWGFFPIFWKQIAHVDALESLSHRIVWTVVFLVLLISVQRGWNWLRPVISDRPTLLRLILASILLMYNWGMYIWAVINGFIVEASLGYFINPLVNVVLGYLIFKERLHRQQLIAVGLAVIGVGYLTWTYGRLPWIALSLAGSFAFYGVLKKQSKLDSIQGLSIESGLMFPIALFGVLFFQWQGSAEFGSDTTTTILILLLGVCTASPLLLFAYGAQRIQFATLGLLQYIAPTLQFLIGVFLYNEPFNAAQLWGFVLIWAGLIVYSADSIIRMRQASTAQVAINRP